MKIRMFAGSLVLLAFAGCGTPQHLIFHQNTILGVDVATTAESGSVHVTLGYDRQTTAFIPKTETLINDKPEKEAMSAVSWSTIKIKGLGHYEVHEQFATGVSALNLAADPNAMKQLSETN